MTVLEIQRRLVALGFDPGPLDGAWGPRTRRAVVAFQRRAKLAADGVAGPMTIAALRSALLPAIHPKDGQAPSPILAEPIWVQEGRRRLGLHESNPKLKAFLKSDGRTLGDPERLPWCGDFVETCLRVALADEELPANPYLARNWLSFGEVVAKPVLGAVAVFWRGTKTGSSGHVGFVVGADDSHLSILGGNQSNTVSVARLSRARLLGCRWPVTAGEIVASKMPKATGDITHNEA